MERLHQDGFNALAEIQKIAQKFNSYGLSSIENRRVSKLLGMFDTLAETKKLNGDDEWLTRAHAAFAISTEVLTEVGLKPQSLFCTSEMKLWLIRSGSIKDVPYPQPIENCSPEFPHISIFSNPSSGETKIYFIGDAAKKLLVKGRQTLKGRGLVASFTVTPAL